MNLMMHLELINNHVSCGNLLKFKKKEQSLQEPRGII